MNWDDARLFLMVARKGQMRAAADALGITQATLSRRMMALEKKLGATLFHRHQSGSDLTEIGERLFARAESAEQSFIKIDEDIRASQTHDLQGSVRLALPDGLALNFIAPRLTKFSNIYPSLQIELVPLPRGFSLSRRDADLAIMVGQPSGENTVTSRLVDYSLSIYASKKYLDNFGWPKDIADLKQHRLIGFVSDLIASDQLDYAQEISRAWKPHTAIHSVAVQMNAVINGAGIGVLHDYLANDNNLVRILPEKTLLRSYWIMMHQTHRHIPRVRAIADFIYAEIKIAGQSYFTPNKV